jgi:16S rRNA C1402 N4-methylase RsmH
MKDYMKDNSAVTVTTYHSREDQPLKKKIQYSSRKHSWQWKGEIPAPKLSERDGDYQPFQEYNQIPVTRWKHLHNFRI